MNLIIAIALLIFVIWVGAGVINVLAQFLPWLFDVCSKSVSFVARKLVHAFASVLESIMTRTFGRGGGTVICSNWELDTREDLFSSLQAALKQQEDYSVSKIMTPNLIYQRFEPQSPEFLSVGPTVESRELDISTISIITESTGARNFRDFLKFADDAPEFGPAKPEKPEIPLPSKPQVEDLQVNEPTLELPYWEAPYTFLNRFVDLAHKEVTDEFQDRQTHLQAMRNNYDYLVSSLNHAYDRNMLAFEDADAKTNASFDVAITKYLSAKSQFEKAVSKEVSLARQIKEETQQNNLAGLKSRIHYSLQASAIPMMSHADFDVRLDDQSNILVVEIALPDIERLTLVKSVMLKSGVKLKPPNQKEQKYFRETFYPALCLRLMKLLSSCDDYSQFESVALNGNVTYIAKATGQEASSCGVSVFATKDQIDALLLPKLDPKEAFGQLSGRTSPSIETIPVQPVIAFDLNDSRFVDSREVLQDLGKNKNLAAMDWEDFEHLCRELFEREFAASGAEVKVTRASRDQGIDAIIHDPHPIKGGKIVVQAKRYTNTVDVSAVRDLFGSVHNEGAMKGILVTTSGYGKESYEFAKDKPLTLVTGSELLALLANHGYKFTIDLQEAKRLLATS